MALYGTAQAGSNATPGLNLTAVSPGDSLTLFDGTETPASGLKSVAFTRGESVSMSDQGTTFYISGMPAGMTMDIQGSNLNLDADYFTLATISPDANGNGAYTDAGRAAFCRAKISAYTTGAMPIVTAQR